MAKWRLANTRWDVFVTYKSWIGLWEIVFEPRRNFAMGINTGALVGARLFENVQKVRCPKMIFLKIICFEKMFGIFLDQLECPGVSKDK